MLHKRRCHHCPHRNIFYSIARNIMSKYWSIIIFHLPFNFLIKNNKVLLYLKPTWKIALNIKRAMLRIPATIRKNGILGSILQVSEVTLESFTFAETSISSKFTFRHLKEKVVQNSERCNNQCNTLRILNKSYINHYILTQWLSWLWKEL